MNLVDSSFHLATFLMFMRVGSLYVKHQGKLLSPKESTVLDNLAVQSRAFQFAMRMESIRDANGIDSLCESIRFVKKISLLIH